MTPKENAKELTNKMFFTIVDVKNEETLRNYWDEAKNCALICIKNEYNQKRELLFNLKSCGIEFSEKFYLMRIQNLINEEKQVKEEINKL